MKYVIKNDTFLNSQTHFQYSSKKLYLESSVFLFGPQGRKLVHTAVQQAWNPLLFELEDVSLGLWNFDSSLIFLLVWGFMLSVKNLKLIL